MNENMRLVDKIQTLTRDPIEEEEEGGVNLYGFCGNDGINKYDRDGQAYFAYRRLLFSPSIFRNNPRTDANNTVWAHEELFFEDGSSPANLGFTDGSQVKQDEAEKYTYVKTDTGYNDCVMRFASQLTPVNRYSMLGIFVKPKYNCQDWAQDVRKKYGELINQPYIRRKCCLK